MTTHLHLRTPTNPAILKLAAMVLLAIPAGLLLLLGFGEMIGGDISGIQHLPEAAVLLILIAAAWRHPWLAGIILLAGGAVFLGAFVALAAYHRDPEGLLPALTIFLPPLLAGALLFRASGRYRGG